jgi:hypothetical protein
VTDYQRQIEKGHTPFNAYQRVRRYLDQSGRGQLTPRQHRRANKKMRRTGECNARRVDAMAGIATKPLPGDHVHVEIDRIVAEGSPAW